jgi:hypothetical protein
MACWYYAHTLRDGIYDLYRKQQFNSIVLRGYEERKCCDHDICAHSEKCIPSLNLNVPNFWYLVSLSHSTSIQVPVYLRTVTTTQVYHRNMGRIRGMLHGII